MRTFSLLTAGLFFLVSSALVTIADAQDMLEDLVDGEGLVSASGPVDNSVPGTYQRKYTAQDSSGNSESTERSVIVAALSCEADPFEPNDAFEQAATAGSVAPGTPGSVSGTICVADDDYFVFTAAEGGGYCFQGTGQYFSLQVDLDELQPAAGSFDLYLYDDGGQEPGQSSSTPWGERVTTSWEGICGVDDSRLFIVRVVGNPPDASVGDYSLTLAMFED